MTLPKNVAERLEFLITFVLSTVAGLLAFLLVWVFTIFTGLYQT